VFFSALQKYVEEGKIIAMRSLIFKGGTLLTKSYLSYHRISEDIDFTHSDCNRIRKIRTSNARERAIKALVVPIIEEIKMICDDCGLDFSTDRTNNNYIRAINSRALYMLTLRYQSMLDGTDGMIKLEISFVEDLLYPPVVLTIRNIIDGQKDNLATLPCYALQEIVAEKCRALLTRKEMKERDIFDLFLMRKKDLFTLPPPHISRKLRAAALVNPECEEIIAQNRKLLQSFAAGSENIDLLVLKRYDRRKYLLFRKELFSSLGSMKL
jgi:hypothetical protein